MPRAECYLEQLAIDLPHTVPPPPSPSACRWGAKLEDAYLQSYREPQCTLGIETLPALCLCSSDRVWLCVRARACVCTSAAGVAAGRMPFANSLAAAQSWCCEHADCGGVTYQDGKYEARKGSTPVPAGSPSPPHSPLFSIPRADHHSAGVNKVNLTDCGAKRWTIAVALGRLILPFSINKIAYYAIAR